MSDNRGPSSAGGHSGTSQTNNASRSFDSSQQGPSSSSSSYAYTGPRRGGEGRGAGPAQRYGDNNRSARGGSFLNSNADRRPQFGGRGGGGGGPVLAEDGSHSKFASYVTPHDAVQDQPAQHGATIVRSGSAATEGGSILFFSSVQKKGGAFTATERETYAQLRQSRAIPNFSRTLRGGGNVVGSGIQTRNAARQFDELEKAREAKELTLVKSALTSAKRSRFTLESDEDESDGEVSDVSVKEGERGVQRPRGEGVAALGSSDSEDG